MYINISVHPLDKTVAWTVYLRIYCYASTVWFFSFTVLVFRLQAKSLQLLWCCKNSEQLGFSSMMITAGTIIFTINFLKRFLLLEKEMLMLKWFTSLNHMLPTLHVYTHFKVYQCVNTLYENHRVLRLAKQNSIIGSWQWPSVMLQYQHPMYIHAWNQSVIFCQCLHQEPISAYGLLVTWKEVYCIINYASFNDCLPYQSH